MFWNRYLFPSIAVLVVTAALHWYASGNGFYVEIWWYDIVMHFLGGAWVALFFLWAVTAGFGSRISPKPVYATFRSLMAGRAGALLAVIAFGVGWEILEVCLEFNGPWEPNYWFDSSIDLIMDSLGAVAAIVAYKK